MPARRSRSVSERAAVAAALGGALALGTRAGAQDFAAVRADCDAPFPVAASAPNAAAWNALSPATFWPAMQPLVAEGRFVALGDSVRAYAERVGALGGGTPPQALRAIDSLRTSLAAVERSWRSGGPGAFVPAVLFQARRPVDPGDSRLTWMVDTPFSLTVDGNTPSEARRAACWPLRVAGLLADAAGKGARDFTIGELRAIRKRWENFRDSYSMLPHELVINEITTRVLRGGNRVYSLDPPRTQIVALHPTLGFQLRPISTSNANGSQALVVDWGGLLVYSNSRATYAGASFISSYPSRAGEGSRYGVMGTWSKLGRLGVLLPRRGESPRRLGAVLNFDAYKLLPQARKAVDEKIADLRGREATCAAAPATSAIADCLRAATR